MTEKTITESLLSNMAHEAGADIPSMRSALGMAGITVVPDPASPLPTEGIWHEQRSDGTEEFYRQPGSIHPDVWADPDSSWERLETQAEGDARVLATLRERFATKDSHAWIDMAERVLREAREGNATSPRPFHKPYDGTR